MDYSVALDFEMESQTGRISLLQIKGKDTKPLILDVCLNKDLMFQSGVKDIICSQKILKIMQDFRQDAKALYNQFKIELQHVYDIQLAFRVYEGEPKKRRSLNYILASTVGEENVEKDNVRYTEFNEQNRPLAKRLLRYAAQDVAFLHSARQALNFFTSDVVQIETSAKRIADILLKNGKKRNRSSSVFDTASAFWSYLKAMRKFERGAKIKLDCNQRMKIGGAKMVFKEYLVAFFAG